MTKTLETKSSQCKRLGSCQRTTFDYFIDVRMLCL